MVEAPLTLNISSAGAGLNLNTAIAAPMTSVFDLSQEYWTFDAKPSSVVLKTDLPLSDAARAAAMLLPEVSITHSSSYWAEKTKGFDFSAAATR